MSEENKAAQQKETKGRTFLYTCGRVLAAVSFHVLGPVRYLHPERVRLDAPWILVSNHWSNMDPLLVGYPVKDYEITFLGKKELTKTKLLKALFHKLHMIPIDRHNTDMEAMRACMRSLRSGEILGIFPEGTRHHQGVMEEVEDGMALIALRSKVPVIPVYIEKKYRLFRKNYVCIGEQIPTEDLLARGVNRETCQELMQRLREAYGMMMEEVREVRTDRKMK